MEIGDKVYCIKDCIKDCVPNYGYFHHTKGEIYNIRNIYMKGTKSEIIFVEVIYPFKFGYLSIKQENSYLFSEYFVEVKEYRKLKLEKINECWR